MYNQTETSQEELPIWIPQKIKEGLKKTLERQPIDLTSREIIGKHFASIEEIQDLYGIINKVEQPVLIGINGSRASLARSTLFENVGAFDKYHKEKSHLEGDLEEYLFQKGLTLQDYEQARKLLRDTNFNEKYKKGNKYPAPTIRLLVSDIDLIIISNGMHVKGGSHLGAKTNVVLDINVNSPNHLFDTDPRDLEIYVKLGLGTAIPIKYL